MAHLVYMRQDVQRRRLAGGGGGGGGNVGQVGSYAALDLAAHPLYSVDMGLNDYSSHYNAQNGGAGTGSTTHNASGWWDGGAYARIVPPTDDGLERGIELLDLYQGGTLAIQNFYLRFEWRMGPTVPTLMDGNGGAHPPATTGPKLLLLHARPTLTVGEAVDRPALFLTPVDTADNGSHNRANTLAMCPASETVQAWGNATYDDASTFDDPPGSLTYYINGPQKPYFTSAGDTGTFQGTDLIPAGEFLTIEMRVLTVASAQYPRGLIAVRITRRNGSWYERGIPYNWSEDFTLGGFITELQQFGCGQWNTAPPAHANMWFDVGGYITAGRDLNDWQGPRTGFVQT
jgi:hypothetical protein